MNIIRLFADRLTAEPRKARRPLGNWRRSREVVDAEPLTEPTVTPDVDAIAPEVLIAEAFALQGAAGQYLRSDCNVPTESSTTNRVRGRRPRSLNRRRLQVGEGA
jgi:hypothetical protein